ncbi:alpha/beta hydrolase [soil metagenome]
MTELAYVVRRPSRSRFIEVRGLRYHVLEWGDAGLATPGRPPLVLVHGWMDVGASFQFMVDSLHALEGDTRHIVALDWRGFGLTDMPAADAYWFPDYMADLEVALDTLFPAERFPQVDLVGHSMGGNVVMVYAGVRPGRIRRLVNLEGFGQPTTTAEMAPQRYADWLDEMKDKPRLNTYASLAAVAARLQKNNPLLRPERAAWVAPHWAREEADGTWHLRADVSHRRTNPVLYQKDEYIACWKRITAPVLWVEGDETDIGKWWGTRYPRSEFEARLAHVPRLQKHALSPAGHMLHHDQPEALALRLREFLDAPG